MKGDFTRSTFDPARHYSGVRMQQGRMQVDADWNEHEDIIRHRSETGTLDALGASGTPLHDAGFSITPAGNDLTIGSGRYYVDGILCENEDDVPFTEQPVPGGTKLPTDQGRYIAFLDVSTRHVSALEAPQIRELALGGPDSATRLQTVWRVGLLRVPPGEAANFGCAGTTAAWEELVAPSTAGLRARTRSEGESPDACIVAPGAGFRRLENQLYRVEIHDPGTVNNATFKWSRDNGSVAAEWIAQNGSDLTIRQTAQDSYRRFAAGQWIELSSDDRDMAGLPGTLVKIKSVQGDKLTLESGTPPGSIDITKFEGHPKVRRWESDGALTVRIAADNDGYLGLEGGVEIRFKTGSKYRSGDYWLIPARVTTRVSTADIEWPRDGENGPPKEMPPAGITHAYCRLAIMQLGNNGWTRIADCRRIFPPSTELTCLHYVGGDGQEATPDPTQPATRIPLARPLQAGVSNGRWPVANARVQFSLKLGSGLVQGSTAPIVIPTGPDGIASCDWQIDGTTLRQQVEAVLLDDAGQRTHLPVLFNASLTRASEAAYDAKACSNLAGAKTVQEAIDRLCALPQSGGCCTTVGKGGDFPTLKEAIGRLLRDRKGTDICICLLAGEHDLRGGLEIIGARANETHVRIHGCGPATRLLLAGGSVVARDLTSLSLQDLSLTVTKMVDRPLMIANCGDVRISGCSFSQTQGFTTLLTISGSDQVEISGCRLESSYHDIIRIPQLEGFAFARASAFEWAIAETKLAQQLAGDPLLLTQVMDKYRAVATKLPATERDAIETPLGRVLEEAQPGAARVPNVTGLRAALSALLFAPALVIDNQPAITLILNNQILGDIRLYGDSTALTTSEFEKLVRAIARLDPAGADLRISGNQLTRVVVDRAVMGNLEGEILKSAFARLTFSENVVASPESQLLATHVIGMGNHFAGTAKDSPAAISRSFTLVFTGNSADSPSATLVHGTTGGRADSANLLTLQPM